MPDGTTIIIANWKMALDVIESQSLTRKLVAAYEHDLRESRVRLALCPSYDSLSVVGQQLKNTQIALGAQDVFWQEKGAYTGEISASMLRALGVSYVIVGHSERRKYLHEDDQMVNQKIKAALAAGLIPVLCVGETYEERAAGNTDLVIMRQVIEGLKGIPLSPEQQLVVAYEPVWVIGTGQAIQPPMAEHSSQLIRQSLIDLYPVAAVQQQTRIIYGGSVDEHNILSYISLPLMKGALVGGAGITTEKFIPLLTRIASYGHDAS